MMLSIKKEDFKELQASKLSIAKLFWAQVKIMSQDQHKITHEQVYEAIEAAHIREFGQNVIFPSFDSFRKFLTKYQKEIY